MSERDVEAQPWGDREAEREQEPPTTVVISAHPRQPHAWEKVYVCKMCGATEVAL